MENTKMDSFVKHREKYYRAREILKSKYNKMMFHKNAGLKIYDVLKITRLYTEDYTKEEIDSLLDMVAEMTKGKFQARILPVKINDSNGEKRVMECLYIYFLDISDATNLKFI